MKKDAPKPKALTSVMEDYLEAIFDLEKEKKVVRVKDIAKRVGVKMPSVSSMLGTLNKRGLVRYEKHEYVELTPEGTAVGREMRRRHQALFSFLTGILNIDPGTADDEACRMEHALSAGTLKSLTDFMEFIEVCPRAGEEWIRRFKEFRAHGKNPERCRENAEQFSCDYQRLVEGMGCSSCGNPGNAADSQD